MESSGLEPVTRTFGTTVVKDDALAAYATHATHTIFYPYSVSRASFIPLFVP
jgi:hypothetical protein